MDIDLSALRNAARLAGFDFADADLEAIRPGLARALHALAHLEAPALARVEPAVQFRML